MEEMLSLAKVADLLGVTPKTIRNWHAAGKLVCYRTIGNHRRVSRCEVDRLLAQMKGESCGRNLVETLQGRGRKSRRTLSKRYKLDRDRKDRG